MPPRKRQRAIAPKSPAGELTVDLGIYEAAVAGFADAIAIQIRDDIVEVSFFESKQRASAIMVARFFITYADLASVWARSSDFYEAMKVMSDRDTWGKYEIGLSPPSEITGGNSPAPLCTVFAVAKIGEAALIECYYFTATSIHRVSKGVGKLKVVPLFAVQVPAGLIWSFFSKIRELVLSRSKP